MTTSESETKRDVNGEEPKESNRIVDEVYERLLSRACGDMALTMHRQLARNRSIRYRYNNISRQPQNPQNLNLFYDSSVKLMSREEMYAEVHQGDGSLEHRKKDPVETSKRVFDTLQKYATEQPLLSKRFRSSQAMGGLHGRLGEASSTHESAAMTTASNTNDDEQTTPTRGSATLSMSTRTSTGGIISSSSSNADIWGRIPPKEPREPVLCRICGKRISTSRFAQHLEKCLGVTGSSSSSTRAAAVAAAVSISSSSSSSNTGNNATLSSLSGVVSASGSKSTSGPGQVKQS